MTALPNLHANTGVISTATSSLVLLIDGRPARIEMLTVALSESWEDLTVLPVTDLPAAVNLVEQMQSTGARPALIVVADAAPALAIEGLRRLKAEPLTSEIPALLVCPQATSGDYQRAVRLGAIELLCEPTSLDGYLRLAAGWQGLLARA